MNASTNVSFMWPLAARPPANHKITDPGSRAWPQVLPNPPPRLTALTFGTPRQNEYATSAECQEP